MNEILKEIDDISWQELKHAYGSAEDIPERLKVLFYPSLKEEGEEAINSFFSNIYHQGTIYSATAYAVPFLIQALNYCLPTLKNSLLDLLICISNGMSYNAQHESYFTEETKTKEYKEETQEQLHWVEIGILNIWKGWEDFINLLQDANPEIRANIPLLLVSLVNSQYIPSNINKETIINDVHKLFVNQLQVDNNTVVQASLIMGIYHLKIPLEKKLPLLDYYLQEEDLLIQVTSAYCITGNKEYILKNKVHPLVIETLSKAAQNTEKVDDVFSPLPWFDMRFSFSLLELLCLLPISYFEQFWSAFENYIKGTFKFCAEYTVTPIIRMIFEGQKINEISSPLSIPQKKVLKCILETPNLWDISDGNTDLEFQRWGLERNQEYIKDLIDKK